MKNLNFQFFSKFWAIAQTYWRGEEKWGAITLLTLPAILIVFFTQLSVKLNTQQGEIFSSLAAKNADRFWKSILIFLIILIIYVPLFVGYNYFKRKLGIYWRRWLTHYFLNQYFSEKTYYNLSHFSSNIDNPDQRISEDIRSFTESSLNFLLLIFQSILTILAFSTVLWKISHILLLFLIIYGVAGTLITAGVFGQKLIEINFNQLRKEANFRFGLVRIRENAESIAFYQGEEQENNQLKSLFKGAFENYNRLIVWETLYLGTFQNIYEFIPYILPAVIVAPSVLSGQFEVGTIREAQGAFLRIFFTLNIFVDQFQNLTSFAAGVERLYTFYEYLEQNKTEKTKEIIDQPTIETREEKRLAIEHLTLQTPNYKRILCQDLSISLQPGQGLLVMGASGCGKSSLLRAIAGLWKSGTGAIYRPKLQDIFFLPQRPYMILGTLREQLLYPHVNGELSEEKIKGYIADGKLTRFRERFGGFDAQKDWSEVLSLGEQQRVAFARLLVTRPKYAILDEATSALDIGNEKNLYQHLLETETTFISVGHRSTLAQYHQLILEFLEGEKWKLRLSSARGVDEGGQG